MKKTLALLSAIGLIPLFSSTSVACTFSKNKDNDHNENKVKKINQSAIRTEIEQYLQNQAFESRQEAIRYLNKNKNWKSEGIESVDSSIYSGKVEASVHIKIILKNNYAWDANQGGEFDVSVSMNISKIINEKIASIASMRYASSKEAEIKICQAITAIDGVADCEFRWLDEANLTFELKLEYLLNVKGSQIITSNALLKINVDQQINILSDQINKNEYDSSTQAATIIRAKFSEIEGVSSVQFSWDDPIAMEYKVQLSFKQGYVGKSLIRGKTNLKQNISSELSTINQNAQNLRYTNTKEAKSIIEANFANHKGIADATLSWLNNTLNYKVNLIYKSGYTGKTIYEGAILIKLDISNQIETKLNDIAELLFNDQLAAEIEIKTEVGKIVGVASVNIASVPNESLRYTYTLIVSYDEENYYGKENYQSFYNLKVNLSSNVLAKQAEFENIEFASYQEAQQTAVKFLESIQGINSIELLELSKEKSFISFQLFCDEKYVLQATLIKWNIEVKFSKIYQISEQKLSYKTDELVKTFKVLGSKLENKQLIATSENSEILQTSIDGQNLTIKATSNVQGNVSTRVAVQVSNEPETLIWFIVSIEGKPEVEVIDQPNDDLIKMRLGSEIAIDFKMNFFDANLSTLSAKPSDEDGQTSAQIVVRNAKEQLYTLKIKALKPNDISNNGQQAIDIWVDQAIVKKFKTQVHELPIIISDVDNSQQLKIALNQTAKINLTFMLSDINDKVDVKPSDDKGQTISSIIKISESAYQLSILGAKQNSWVSIGGHQDVMVMVNNQVAWKINTRVR